MIHLSDDQRQALEQAGQNRAVPVYDARNGVTYFLLPAPLYERVRGQLEEPAADDGPDIPPGIRRSKEAFLRELPELLQKKRLHGQWVAYHGDQRLGFGRFGWKLYHECLRRGLRGDDFYVGIIQEQELAPESIDESLFEFDEVELDEVELEERQT